MKPGYNQVGKFTIHLYELPAGGLFGLPAGLYEVFVYETKTMYYRNIMEEPFNWFGQFASFKNEITPSDILTYNTHVSRKHLGMPTFRMTSEAVKNLFKMASSIK